MGKTAGRVKSALEWGESAGGKCVAATSGGRFSEKTEFHQSQNLAATTTLEIGLLSAPSQCHLQKYFLLLITSSCFFGYKNGGRIDSRCEHFLIISQDLWKGNLVWLMMMGSVELSVANVVWDWANLFFVCVSRFLASPDALEVIVFTDWLTY